MTQRDRDDAREARPAEDRLTSISAARREAQRAARARDRFDRELTGLIDDLHRLIAATRRPDGPGGDECAR